MKGLIRLLGKFLFIILLLGILFAYAMFEGGFVSWFLFYSFLPILLYEICLLLYPLKNWRISRHLNHHVVRAGEKVTVTIRMKRSLPFPLYYCICEEVFPPSMQKVNLQHETYQYLNTPEKLNVVRRLKRVIFPWFKRNIEETYVLQEIPRGEHHFQAIRVRMSDMFGFIHKEYVFPVDDELIAYPTTRPIYMAGRVSAFDTGEQSAHSFHLKSTNIATGTREYVPGDKFSWIDWKQTARKNELITKEFEQEKSTDTMIILNACYHEGFNLLAFEAAVEVTFSMVDSLYRQASKVDFLSIGEKSVYNPLHHDETKRLWIRDHLTTIEPFGKTPFAGQLKEETSKIGGGFIMVLVTTQLNVEIKNTILQMGIRMKRIIVIFIQGSNRITEAEYDLIQQLRFQGVVMNILTEKDLIRHAIEVNVV